MIAGIRKVGDSHIVILETAQWRTKLGVSGPPLDDNRIYEFHQYRMATDESVISPYLEYRAILKAPGLQLSNQQ